jgi:hypothetical protein
MSILQVGTRERMLADILREKGIPIENYYGAEYQGVTDARS